VYNDLKPDNLLLDYKKDPSLDSINLVDFGFVSNYLERSEHIEMKELNQFQGNLMNSSMNQMEFKSSSRRDDMIALLYLTVYLLNGTLPWLCIQNDKQDPMVFLEQVLEIKR
jgi:serine/threonine protein kinase